MASHQLAIAKASFSAGLLRPDPTSISRDEIAHFHALIGAVSTECSSANIQQCKHWILSHVVQSFSRLAAFGKYLRAFSASLTGSSSSASTAIKGPSAKRRRLFLLYLINDLLYHGKFRSNNVSIAGGIQPALVELFSDAASFQACPKHLQRVKDLLVIWHDKNYYATDYIDKLLEAVTHAAEKGPAAKGSDKLDLQGRMGAEKKAKNTPFVMPAIHGDHGTPWFDLPAGNLIPHIVPNSTRPINPALVKPLKFLGGPADEGVSTVVKSFLQDVEKMFGAISASEDPFDETRWNIDDLGQPVMTDEITGEVLGGEGYYGWSRQFCEKMRRRRGGLDPGDEQTRRRSRSGSASSSQSGHSIKRRRYSDYEDDFSGNSSRNRSQEKYGGRSPHHSRPSSREGRGIHQNGHADAWLGNEARSAWGQRNDTGTSDSIHPGHDRFSAPDVTYARTSGPNEWQSQSAGVLQGSNNNVPYGSDGRTISVPRPFNAFPETFGRGHFPVPPAPPPDYQGTWPPPPPPPPPPPYLRGPQGGAGWQTGPHEHFIGSAESGSWLGQPKQGVSKETQQHPGVGDFQQQQQHQGGWRVPGARHKEGPGNRGHARGRGP